MMANIFIILLILGSILTLIYLVYLCFMDDIPTGRTALFNEIYNQYLKWSIKFPKPTNQFKRSHYNEFIKYINAIGNINE